jgi:hypothetical protein
MFARLSLIALASFARIAIQNASNQVIVADIANTEACIRHPGPHFKAEPAFGSSRCHREHERAVSVPLAMDNYCTSIKRIPLINQFCRKPAYC